MSLRFTIYLILLLLIVLYGLIRINRLENNFKALVAYISAIFLVETTNKVYGLLYDNNQTMYHFLIPLQILFYAYFLNSISLSTRISRRYYLFAIIAVTLSILNSLFIQDLKTFPSNGVILLTLFIVPISLNSFKSLLNIDAIAPLRHNALFLISLGNLIFYCSTFLTFSHFNFTQSPPEWMFILIWAANLLMYGSYFISIRLNVEANSNQIRNNELI